MRLADVIAEGVAGEDVAYATRPGVVRWNLHESGASSEEITYLMKQRVELNAFTADALVKWVEKKLDEHGIKKVVPDTDTLAHAYRREKQSAYLRPEFEKLLAASSDYADGPRLGRNVVWVVKRLETILSNTSRILGMQRFHRYAGVSKTIVFETINGWYASARQQHFSIMGI